MLLTIALLVCTLSLAAPAPGQGLGGALIERIEGSYSNVVGLPLAETLALLDAARVPHGLSPR